jgi:low affinity Fe/Cu permease
MVKKVNNNVNHKKVSLVEKLSTQVTNWIGTPSSIVVHTLFFIGIFALGLFGFTLDKILLLLTTAVSLEAIYLAIFIQMTVNRQAASIRDIEEDIDDIQEDVEDLSEDVEDISEDIDRFQGDDDSSAGKDKSKLGKIIEGITGHHS